MKKIIRLAVAMVIAAICFSSCHVQSTVKQSKKESVVVVDLGLPSGTLWADRNVGADNPEDAGDYFAWGETTTKSTYSWSNYKHGNDGDSVVAKKYNKSDRRTTLERIDDVAYQQWGSDWCLPTQAQIEELGDECTWTWTTRNGKNGYEVKSKRNGNSIFLPATGYKGSDGTTSSLGSYGYYWSSSLGAGYPDDARGLNFGSNYVDAGYVGGRSYGQSVRPVRCRN